jgi:hypothetical protein
LASNLEGRDNPPAVDHCDGFQREKPPWKGDVSFTPSNVHGAGAAFTVHEANADRLGSKLLKTFWSLAGRHGEFDMRPRREHQEMPLCKRDLRQPLDHERTGKHNVLDPWRKWFDL